MSAVRDRTWRPRYSATELDLVSGFYIPALRCALRYDRTTGYFQASALALAAHGLEGLVRNGGRMRLLVGCTLGPLEVAAIEKGTALREVVAQHLADLPLEPPDLAAKEALELLAWMVSHEILDVKVAVLCDRARRPIPMQGIFHEKCGVVEDAAGDRLAFCGSLNETAAGWRHNWDSFHVFTSWTGSQDHVAEIEKDFASLWTNRALRALVLDVPSAAKRELLRFLPPDREKPARLQAFEDEQDETAGLSGMPTAPAGSSDAESAPTTAELKRLVWGIIRHAPAMPGGGERVGEATCSVRPWPHQVRAFQRLYDGDGAPPRLMIADEVGLGKTIQAGMLLRQSVLSGRTRRVLILAPKAVLRQWQIELREKFNLDWPIYDGHELQYYPSQARGDQTVKQVGPSEWHQVPFVIMSSQLARRTDRAREILDQADPWDLVILDEAHHARRRSPEAALKGKDRGPNHLLKLMRGLAAPTKTKGLLLLTATPMQVSPVEVWDLLALLGLPSEWDCAAFVRYFEKVGEPSPSELDFEWLSSLFRACEAAFGKVTDAAAARFMPDRSAAKAQRLLADLRDRPRFPRRNLDAANRRAALGIMKSFTPVTRRMSRHTRELLRKYQQDGTGDTRIAIRSVDDRFVELTADERKLYEAVEDYISATYNKASTKERNAVGFVMTIYRRRMASSFYSLIKTLDGRLGALTGEGRGRAPIPIDDDLPDDDTSDDIMDEREAQGLLSETLRNEEEQELRSLRDQARRLPVDTKTRRLVETISELRTAGYRQVMVFTQYTDTLDYLRGQLTKTSPGTVMCFSGRGGELQSPDGSWQKASREDIKRRFKQGSAEILLCTDAAAEGLNFQFCGALINYDLPWNPMRVEQRIGRIDRLGQAYETIRIVNLHYLRTVESDVYQALIDRHGLFGKIVGKLQPILARLPKNFAAATLSHDRDQQRENLVANLEAEIAQADGTGLDLDEVVDVDLCMPERLPPLYSLDDLDALLHHPELLPPGVSVERLHQPREYRFLAPGLKQALRITTDPSYFEDHPESLELWSPGSLMFGIPEDSATAEAIGKKASRLGELLNRSETGDAR